MNRKRILIVAVILVVLAALWGQYTMWQRYGVFDWWSARPQFLKADGRDYARGDTRAPAPHYCVIESMFPFDYPIAAEVEDGPDGRPCPPARGAGTFVYLRWKDGKWTVYGLQGGP